MSVSGMGVCGVVLSAGRGTRLAPFSDTRPKASFPVGSRSLLDRAVDLLRPFVEDIAVNASGHTDWCAANVPPGVRTFEEGSEPLGTAGGLYNMREWIAGRDVVVLNADSVLFGDVAASSWVSDARGCTAGHLVPLRDSRCGHGPERHTTTD
jgi:N-acetyl-alpha-D-muramate 1-phosphate uridylyltransferase